jgi:NAD+ kinase
MTLKKIGIVTNFNIYEKASAALSVADKLHSLCCEVLVASFNRDKINRQRLGKRDFISFIPLEKIYQEAELIIVLGGDGTILESARKAAPAGIPLLGINLGRLGYMAELELDETDRLAEIVDGKYRLDRRMMIKVEVIGRDGNVKFESFALNDAVISNGVTARMIDLALSEGGAAITNYRADGLIIATPTGSTAYSLSAGGAVVDPRLECFCVTPICPHALGSRPLVFQKTAVIEVKNVCQREKVLFLTLDGRVNFEVAYNDTVRITESDMATELVRVKDNCFYNQLRKKMNFNI